MGTEGVFASSPTFVGVGLHVGREVLVLIVAPAARGAGGSVVGGAGVVAAAGATGHATGGASDQGASGGAFPTPDGSADGGASDTASAATTDDGARMRGDATDEFECSEGDKEDADESLHGG